MTPSRAVGTMDAGSTAVSPAPSTVNICRMDKSERTNCRAWRHCPEWYEGRSVTGKQPPPPAKGSAPLHTAPPEEEEWFMRLRSLDSPTAVCVLENPTSREGPGQVSQSPSPKGTCSPQVTGTGPFREIPAMPSTSYVTLGKSHYVDMPQKAECSKD